MKFVYLIRPCRPDFIQTMTPEEDAVVDHHFSYLKRAFEAGQVSYVGRCEDGAFGLSIFEAEDLAAAERFAAADPAIAAKIFDVEVHAFKVVFS